MSKRKKILLCILAAALVIGLATGAFTFGDIARSLIGGDPVQAVQQDDTLETVQLPEQQPESVPAEEGQPESVPVEEGQPESLPPEDEQSVENESETPEATQAPAIAEDGHYSTKDDVALYIHTYGRLPDNFITKSEARALGWEGGSVEDYAPGCSIGGDRFGNYEGILPDGKYTECDIDTLGRSSRGAKRIVFSNDGRIYYTEDHYETFELLYGEE